MRLSTDTHDATRIILVLVLSVLIGISFVSCGSSSSTSSKSTVSSSALHEVVADKDVPTSFPGLYSYSDGPLYVEYNEDKVISYKDAGNYIGQQITVEGPVSSVYYVPNVTGSPYYINFGNRQFCAVIWEEDQNRIDTLGLDLLVDWSMSNEPMNVFMRVSGVVSVYNGEPQVVVRSFDQIAANTEYGWATYPTDEIYQEFGKKLNALRGQQRNN